MILSSSAHNENRTKNTTHFAKSDDAFLGSHTATLDHDEVIVNLTIMRETTHGGDGLVSQVVLGSSVVLDNLSTKKKCKPKVLYVLMD